MPASRARLAQRRQQLGALLGAFRDHDLVEGLNPLGHLLGKACLGWHCLFCAHRSGSLTCWGLGPAVQRSDRHGPLLSITS